MNQRDFSRRQFALIAGSLAATRFPARAAAGPTAQELVKRIQGVLGGDWLDGPDGFKAGNPETPVRGVATTAMATMDVLKRASNGGLNLIVTYEPTFFGLRDGPATPAPNPAGRGRGPAGVSSSDPVYTAKKEFIEKNGLVVWRLRDHWQARKENDLTVALAESLGWARYRVSSDDVIYDIPASTLEETVALIRRKLNLRGGLRSVGDPRARVRRVMLHPGLMAVSTMLHRFSETDLIVAGEVREWECTHYAADINATGEKRSLVTVGRVASEDPGMRSCANWLKPVAREIPVRWVTAGDPYWRAV